MFVILLVGAMITSTKANLKGVASTADDWYYGDPKKGCNYPNQEITEEMKNNEKLRFCSLPCEDDSDCNVQMPPGVKSDGVKAYCNNGQCALGCSFIDDCYSDEADCSTIGSCMECYNPSASVQKFAGFCVWNDDDEPPPPPLPPTPSTPSGSPRPVPPPFPKGDMPAGSQCQSSDMCTSGVCDKIGLLYPNSGIPDSCCLTVANGGGGRGCASCWPNAQPPYACMACAPWYSGCYPDTGDPNEHGPYCDAMTCIPSCPGWTADALCGHGTCVEYTNLDGTPMGVPGTLNSQTGDYQYQEKACVCDKGWSSGTSYSLQNGSPGDDLNLGFALPCCIKAQDIDCEYQFDISSVLFIIQLVITVLSCCGCMGKMASGGNKGYESMDGAGCGAANCYAFLSFLCYIIGRIMYIKLSTGGANTSAKDAQGFSLGAFAKLDADEYIIFDTYNSSDQLSGILHVDCACGNSADAWFNANNCATLMGNAGGYPMFFLANIGIDLVLCVAACMNGGWAPGAPTNMLLDMIGKSPNRNMDGVHGTCALFTAFLATVGNVIILQLAWMDFKDKQGIWSSCDAFFYGGIDWYFIITSSFTSLICGLIILNGCMTKGQDIDPNLWLAADGLMSLSDMGELDGGGSE